MSSLPTIVGLADALQSDPRVSAALLFGSVARGQARPESDVDIAVLYAGPSARDSFNRELLTVLGRLSIAAQRDVHLIDLEQVDCAFRRKIFATSETLFDRSRGRLRNLLAATLIEYFDGAYTRNVIDAGHREKLGLAGRHG
jgi:predicted nucleotidyltransferase